MICDQEQICPSHNAAKSFFFFLLTARERERHRNGGKEREHRQVKRMKMDNFSLILKINFISSTG